MSATYAQLPQPDDDTIGSPEPHTAAPDSPTIPPARSSRPIADQAIPPPIALAPLGASSSAAPAALPPAAPSYAPLDQASLAQQRRREQVKRLVVFSLAAFAAALLLYRMRDPSTDASSPPSGDSSSPSFAPPKIRLPHLASYVASLADGHRDPCRDFYEFSCASWLKEVGTVPVEWGVLNQAMGAIAYINMLTTQYLLDLVQVSPSPAPSATLPESASAVEVARQNVLTPLWVSCIDTETQEKRGFTYLHELFTAYEPSQFHDSASFIEAAAMHMNSPPFWELEIGVLSEFNATRKLLALQATGLNDDFTGYFMDVPGLRDQYTEYVRSMLKRVGGHSSEAADVVAFEYAIAGMDLSFAEQFIEGADAIRALQPSWNWTRLMELAYIDLERTPSFTVFTDAAEYFPQLDALIQSYIDDGKQRALTAYLQYHMYISIGSVMAPSLQPDPLGFSDVSTKRKEQASWVQQLVDAHVLHPHRATPRQLRRVRETAPKSRLPLFRFLGHAKRYLSDYAATKHDPAAEQAEWRFFEEKMLLAKPDVSAAMRKPWSQASPKRFCQLIAGLFQQDTVGKLYVDYTWRDETEPAVRSTIGRIRSGLHATIEAANWMDEPTKQAALDKLEKLQQRIGAPKVADYRDIQLDKRKYLENLVDMSRRDWIERVESLYVPVNRSAWMEAPQGEVAIVNAFYVPTLNEAFLPAGLIQRKMFDESFPEAYNLGGYGMVAGHELGHAFDDSGRQFDAVGSVRDWWSDESEAAFSERASCFEQEYSQFNVGGTYLNGSFVLNENLGDATGVTVAFNAMGAQTGGTGVTLPQFGELSPQQLFFVSYGQNWCEAVNPLYQQRLFEAQVDPHSPGFARVLGVLRNSAAFQEAFQCPAGSPMNPASKCTLW